MIESVRQVVKIEHITDAEAIWIWGEPSKKCLSQEFSFSVWNVWKQSGGEDFEREFQLLAEQSELVLAQEVLLTKRAIKFFAGADFQAVHGATYRRLDGLRDGVMTLSKAYRSKEPQRIVSKTVEPLLKTTKAALLTYYQVRASDETSFSELAVVNIHCNLIRTPKTAKNEVLRLVEILSEHEGPIIFAGDFNTFSKAYLREISKALDVLGVVQVKIEKDPRKPIGQLDQIFTRGLKIISIDVDTSYKKSDHFPIICRVSI